MRLRLAPPGPWRPALTAMAIVTIGLTSSGEEPEPNTLTEQERAAGWRLLFDGEKANGWRGFGEEGLPQRGWEIGGGWLVKRGGTRPGNIVTRDEFTDFEFSWEWRMAEGGNNGVKYFVDEERGNLGHEYQMLTQRGRELDKGSTASFYAVLPPRFAGAAEADPGVNHSRIVVQGNNVQHWLNGKLALEYECGSEKVLSGVASSKFKPVKDFGEKLTGRIMLTDHGSECAFRNLKVRELTEQ